MTEALRLEGVRVRFGANCVLDGVDLRVAPGEAVVISGLNGSGKTTLLDVVSGFVRPDEGHVQVKGRDVTGLTPRARARAGLRRAFQDPTVWPSLTVSEVLAVSAGAAQTDDPAVRTAVTRWGLDGLEERRTSDLSSGKRRLLDIAAAVSAPGAPGVLLLDEPAAGLDAEMRGRLSTLLAPWRAAGGAVVVVEHDPAFAGEIGARTLVLREGKLHEPNGKPAAGGEIANALPPAPPLTAAIEPLGPSAWTLARFGLREFAAGMMSVLVLGVLNRVMKVELGLPLWAAAATLALYNLGAPAALWVGHRSERTSWFGLRRTPWIVGGAAVAATGGAAAPWVARFVAAQSASVPSIVVAAAVFALMGAGMYGGGAAYFALLSERVPPQHRPRAAAVVYSMLMAGILAGVALTATVVDANASGLESLFGLGAVALIALTLWAVWGAEERGDEPETQPHLVDALRRVAGSKQARRFFAFMAATTFFAFLQQATLEPFGGDVLGLDVRATTSFNAIQIAGVLAGMALGSRTLAPRHGERFTALCGLVWSSAAFAVLAAGSVTVNSLVVWASVAAMGVGLGLVNVGAISLMLGMTAPSVAGLAMGMWTLAHAVAHGLATASGGAFHEAGLALWGSERLAYGGVFALEALGMAVAVAVLVRLDTGRFRAEAG